MKLKSMALAVGFLLAYFPSGASSADSAGDLSAAKIKELAKVENYVIEYSDIPDGNSVKTMETAYTLVNGQKGRPIQVRHFDAKHQLESASFILTSGKWKTYTKDQLPEDLDFQLDVVNDEARSAKVKVSVESQVSTAIASEKDSGTIVKVTRSSEFEAKMNQAQGLVYLLNEKDKQIKKLKAALKVKSKALNQCVVQKDRAASYYEQTGKAVEEIGAETKGKNELEPKGNADSGK